jgi:hypothetical protein
MQSVNDDMEDLIRKAAKDYPLDTSGADWSKVQKALAAEEADAPAQKKRDNRKFLLLLLLLPIGFLCNRYFINSTDEGANVKAPQANTISTEGSTVQNNNSPDPVPSSSTPAANEKSKDQDQGTHERSNSPMKTNREGGKMKTTGNGRHPSNLSAMNLPPPPFQLNQKPAGDQRLMAITANQEHNSLERESPMLLKGKDYSFRLNDIIPLSAFTNTQFLNKSVTVEKERISEKGFYAGLNGGFVATSIKGQKVDRLGTDFGVIVGYNINRKWSIESGIISADKEYYTDGKYFDKYHLNPPSYAVITDMTGNCRMLEIPLAVKYNVTPHFFATTGFTTYIMKQENYQYKYYYPSSGTSSDHYKTYNESYTYPVANLSLSAGYSKEVWYKTNVRIEPFVQIPLRGVGTGKLPFTNVGVHIGLTRKLY